MKVLTFPLNFLLFFGGVLKFSTTKEYLSSVRFGLVCSGSIQFGPVWFGLV